MAKLSKNENTKTLIHTAMVARVVKFSRKFFPTLPKVKNVIRYSMRRNKHATEEQMKSLVISHVNMLFGDSEKSTLYWDILVKTLVRIRYGQYAADIESTINLSEIKTLLFGSLQKALGRMLFLGFSKIFPGVQFLSDIASLRAFTEIDIEVMQPRVRQLVEPSEIISLLEELNDLKKQKETSQVEKDKLQQKFLIDQLQIMEKILGKDRYILILFSFLIFQSTGDCLGDSACESLF
jgi:RNase P/RNase MRP subunit POP5